MEGSCCVGGAAAWGKHRQGHVLLASSALGSLSLLSATGAGPSTKCEAKGGVARMRSKKSCCMTCPRLSCTEHLMFCWGTDLFLRDLVRGTSGSPFRSPEAGSGPSCAWRSSVLRGESSSAEGWVGCTASSLGKGRKEKLHSPGSKRELSHLSRLSAPSQSWLPEANVAQRQET